MSNLQITARYQIPSGNLAEFKKIAKECHSIVKGKDKDTLQYDWYFDESQTECVLRETYHYCWFPLIQMDKLAPGTRNALRKC